MYRTAFGRIYGKAAGALEKYMEAVKLPLEPALAQLIPELRDLCKQVGLSWEDLAEIQSRPAVKDAQATSKVTYINIDKGYGFTSCGTFFHINDGIVLGCTGAEEPEEIAAERELPEKGDMIVFEKTQQERHDRAKANWWSLHQNFMEAWKQIRERPTYRLVSIGTDLMRWEGKDLRKVRLLYPKSFDLGENGIKVQRLEKSEKTATGWDWVDCDDPR